MGNITLTSILLLLTYVSVGCTTPISPSLRGTSVQRPGDVLIFTDGGPIPEYLLQGQYELYPIPYASHRKMFPGQRLRRKVVRRRRPTTDNSTLAGPLVDARRTQRSNTLELTSLSTPSSEPQNVSSTSHSTMESTQSITQFPKRIETEDNVVVIGPQRRVTSSWRPSGLESGVISPYAFGYRIDDGHGSQQHRQESSGSDGVVRGSYGFKDYLGVYRLVNYIADDQGFRAAIKSNEPGLDAKNSAGVLIVVEPPPAAAIVQANAYLQKATEEEKREK